MSKENLSQGISPLDPKLKAIFDTAKKDVSPSPSSNHDIFSSASISRIESTHTTPSIHQKVLPVSLSKESSLSGALPKGVSFSDSVSSGGGSKEIDTTGVFSPFPGGDHSLQDLKKTSRKLSKPQSKPRLSVDVLAPLIESRTVAQSPIVLNKPDLGIVPDQTEPSPVVKVEALEAPKDIAIAPKMSVVKPSIITQVSTPHAPPTSALEAIKTRAGLYCV